MRGDGKFFRQPALSTLFRDDGPSCPDFELTTDALDLGSDHVEFDAHLFGHLGTRQAAREQRQETPLALREPAALTPEFGRVPGLHREPHCGVSLVQEVMGSSLVTWVAVRIDALNKFSASGDLAPILKRRRA